MKHKKIIHAWRKNSLGEPFSIMNSNQAFVFYYCLVRLLKKVGERLLRKKINTPKAQFNQNLEYGYFL